MRINIKNIFLFLLLIGTLGACDTFKDENSSDYVELPKNIQGTWQLMEVTRNGIDISQKMDFTNFHLLLNKDNTYVLENYLPFVVRKNGVWKMDDPEYPHFLIFTEDDASYNISSAMKYPIANGKRRISLTFSTGCESNVYTYVFDKIAD